jgi:hypothetical protein
MSNSLKESKVLLEGWRKFLVKEAEEPKPEGGNVVRIFDFDGTLRLAPKEFPLLDNPFFMTNITPYAKSLITKNETIQQSLRKNEELKDLIRPTDYVISSVASSGLPKGKQYFYELVKKGDAPVKDFFEKYLQVDISKIKEPKDLEKFFLLAPTEQQEEMPVTMERSEEIQKKQIKDFLKKQYGITLPEDHILVGTNVAKTDSQGKVIKGTSGKVVPAEEVYKSIKDKNSKFELYDNSSVSLAQVRKGLLSAKLGEEEAPDAEEVKTDEKMSVADAISKIKSLIKSLQAEKSLGLKSFMVASDGSVAPYTKPYSLSKGGPGEKSAERTYQTLKNLLMSIAYSNGVIVPNVGTPPKEPTTARAKAVHEFLKNKGMSVSADTLKRFAGKRASLDAVPDVATLTMSAETNNKFIEELGNIVQIRAELISAANKAAPVSQKQPAAVDPSKGKPTEEPEQEQPLEPEEEYDPDYEGDRDYDESLRETILKELKPFLKQLNGVLSNKRNHKK